MYLFKTFLLFLQLFLPKRVEKVGLFSSKSREKNGPLESLYIVNHEKVP